MQLSTESTKAIIAELTKQCKNKTKRAPVVVCTDKRGVVFGYTKNIKARPIKLKQARMCLYWPKEVGGVFGLGDIGPNSETKISAVLTMPEA